MEGIGDVVDPQPRGRGGAAADETAPHEAGSQAEHADQYNLVYMSMVLAGIGFLLPYNSFVSAVDFYQQRFEGHLIVFDISMTYIAVMLLSVLLTNLLVTKVHLRWRITFGYLVALVVLFLNTIFDVILNVFPQRWSYGLTLVCAAIVSLGCTVQQSSFYGLASLLPRRYAQAVMLGESCAGLLVSLNRLLTKKVVTAPAASTALFFILSSCLLLLCLVTFTLAVKTPFVRQFILPTSQRGASAAAAGFRLMTEEDRVRMLPGGNSVAVGSAGVDNPNFQAEMREITDPDNQSNPASCGVRPQTVFTNPIEVALLNVECCASFDQLKAGLQTRLRVAHSIWRYMLAIGLCYLVTLSLFPGIESEIPSCDLREWAPVLLMAVFNGFDLIGKVLAALRVPWRSSLLLMSSIIRFCLLPFFMAAASPRQKPHIRGEGWAYFLTAALGITNGYFGSVPMILAPKTVPDGYREIAGNLMTLSYSIGLTAGSGVAYWLDDLLGPLPAKLTTWQYACGLYNVSQVIGRL